MLQPHHFRAWEKNREGRTEELHAEDRASLSAWNLVPGSVLSIHQGLTMTGTRIKVGEHATLRVRWPTGDRNDDRLRIGQQVVVRISPSAVLLGAPGVWPGKDRWNRWTGRIVLVEPGRPNGMVTVKSFGENWTLMSAGSVLGLGRLPQTWDTVNIVVDPAKVRLDHQVSRERRGGCHWTTAGTNQTPVDRRVWMKGRLSGDVSDVPSGWFLPLEIGTAHVGAVVAPEQDIPQDLVAGSELEVHIDQGEAWLKLSKWDPLPIPCSLVYTSGDPAADGRAVAGSSDKG
jgi:hypothetical protein